ncbi:hypothetical protein FA727_10705 [Robertmurraya kyonggiensis]|uniref:Uncharacterized protein n=1 Tax=Robertmurraya kyonggiensis TaxID=1037680 RepID=A0A4U1DBI6_9BACI|nr:hypothetical protein FA727_10705 [Robertmurraya kyonggiensis]
MERKVLDSWGICGTGEIPQERPRRGSSPPAPRKAKHMERKSMVYSQCDNERNLTRFPFLYKIKRLSIKDSLTQLRV